MFVQDTWHPHERVTLDLGLRCGASPARSVLLYLQSATVPGVPPEQLGRQQFRTHELGVFVQDTWHPHDRDLGRGMAASVGYIHARTDNLFRFVNRNDAVLGAPFGIGTHPAGGGINALTVTESSARSRYQALTAGLRGRGGLRGRPITFETHYTLAFDRSDDDNERDPFTVRYAHAGDLTPEYGWSDRDRRHQVSGYVLLSLPAEVELSHVVRYLSASPASEQCANRGTRAAQPADRICADGSIVTRNTLRRQNEFFTWDLRVSRRFPLGAGTVIEPIFEVFNLTNADNFVDPAVGSLLFNFDGTLRSGLGDTRRAQAGLSVRF